MSDKFSIESLSELLLDQTASTPLNSVQIREQLASETNVNTYFADVEKISL